MPNTYFIPGLGFAKYDDNVTLEQALAMEGVAAPTPAEPTGGSDFIDDVQRGGWQAAGMIGSALRDAPVVDGVGKWLEDRSNQGIRDNPADYPDWDKVQGIGGVLGFAGERIAEVIPQAAGAFGAAVLGTAAAPAAIPAGIAAGIGAGAFGLGQSYGGIRQDQREQGIDDKGRAFAAALPAAALDTLTGVGGRVVGSAARRVGGEFVDSLAGRVAKNRIGAVALTGLEEGVTEVGQEALQRWGAYNDLTGDEAESSYRNAFAAGVFGGGALGGVMGPRRERTPAPVRDDEPTDLLKREAQPDLFGGEDTVFTPSAPAPQEQFASLQSERSRLTRNMAEAEKAGDAAKFYQLQDAVMQIDEQLKDPALQQLARGAQRDAAFAADQPNLFRNPPKEPLLGLPSPDMLNPNPTVYVDSAGNAGPSPDLRGARLMMSPEGSQGNLFDLEPDLPEADVRTDEGGQASVPMAGAGQPSLFGAAPTAGVRTGFGQRDILMRLRQAADFRGTKGKQGTPKETTGGFAMKADGYTLSLAQKLSNLLSQDNAFEAVRFLDAQEESLQTGNLTAKTLDQRIPVLQAARQVVDEYNRSMTDAYAQEARMREPQPGAQVSNDAPAEFVRQQVQSQQQAEMEAQQRAATEQQQADQARVDTLRTEQLRDLIDSGAPQRVVQDFLKFVASGKGEYGEVGLRENERAMLDEARQIRRKRAEVKEAFARDEAQRNQQQQRQADGEGRRQQMEQGFAKARSEREMERRAARTARERDVASIEQAPVAEEVPTLDQLMERAGQPEARTPTVLDRMDGPQPQVVTRTEPNPEPTPPKPTKKKPAPKKETAGDKIKRAVAERNKATREKLKPKPKAEAAPKVEAEPKAGPKVEPEAAAQDDGEITYEKVLEEAESYLADDGESGALKPKQFQQLTILAEQESVTPKALKLLLDKALDASARQLMEKSTGPKFREGENASGAGVTKASVAARVANIVKNWKSDQRVNVIESLDELPTALAKKVREAGQESSWGFVDDNGTVYLMAQNLPSLDVATSTLYHEALGHIGLEKQFGNRLDSVLEQLYNSNERLRAEADGWIAANATAYKGENLIARATEEVLARRSENGPLNANLLSKIVAVIKDFARRVGLDLKYTDGEVMTILAMAHTNVTGGGKSRLDEGLRYITTWHGSPHDHNKFSTKYIGSGEGNAAFGWGIYVSEERNVAETYREMLARNRFMLDGEPANLSDLRETYGWQSQEYRGTAALILGNGDIEAALEKYREGDADEATIERIRAAAEAVQDRFSMDGKVYQLNTPDADYMLDWFKPLPQQPSRVKVALSNLGFDINAPRTAGADIYTELQRKLGSKKRASMKLLDAGVLGVKYPVGAASGKRTGPSNYVIFDDSKIEIKAKFREADPAQTKKVEAAINKLPEGVRSSVFAITDELGNALRKGMVWSAFTEDLADMARKLIPASKDYTRLMMDKVVEREKLDRAINEVAERFQNLPVRFQNLGKGTVNGFIQEMDEAGVWAFKPDWLDKVGVSYEYDANSELAATFKGLPKAAQDVIRDMFEQNFNLLRLKKEAAEESIGGTYKELIAAAEARNDVAEVEQLKADRKEALAEVARLLAIQENKPYASRRRYGNFIVVGKSKALKDAISTGAPQKEIEALKASEDDYYVQRFETVREAKAEERRLAAEGKYDTLVTREADKVADELVGGKEMMLAFQRLRDYIKAQAKSTGANDRVLAGINKLAADLYIGALKSTSARKSEQRRLGVAGGDMDMMRNFVTQGRADAHFIGAMKYNEDILDAMNRMRREAGDDENENPELAMSIYNEMMLRHIGGMNYVPSRLADNVKSATSAYLLTTNISYYLQNLTQPWVLSLPYIAGKHGHRLSSTTMLDAYKQVGKIWGDKLSPLEIEKISDPDVRRAVEDLANMGAIDIGADKDMGEFHSLSKNAASVLWSKVSNGLRSATRKTESINRVATAITAYQLERRAGATHEQAVDYAYRVNRLTNGSYDGFNAPRFMRGPVGSVVTQFKKFQLMQVTLLARLMQQSLKAADPVERAVARRTLAFTLGHTAVLAGGMGLPGMSAITWALNGLLGDEDEPADIENSIRKAIGDETIANMLLKGVPTLGGMDISSRVGMGQAFSVIPYVEPELNREGYEKTFTALAGPFFGGLMPKMVDGLGQMRDGKFYNGLAQMLPNGVGNGIRAMVEANDGVRKRNGDVLLTPEEIDFGQTVARVLGVQTTDVSERMRRTTRQTNVEQFYKDATADLNQRFAEARENGDTAEMAEVRKEWAKLQEARVRNGLKKQPISGLVRYAREKQRREDATIRGVQYRPKSPAYYEALAEEDE